MKFGSVCSGIEAASVAWEGLGWRAAWLAEIESFPSAVLAHHYPDVPNHGDMTKLPERIASGEVEAPDIFCGGTPCQAFSVAGQRKSLDDARGNLSLTFCEIANAIDDARLVRGEQPSIVFWENVPGVLSTKDNAFGCFLAQLCGGSEPLHAPGGWTNAGCVSGPKRTAAWRVLDAQYFGVAQRRRRVFVVASARNDFDPAAVLFEFDGLRRDSAPSRQTRQGVAGGVEIGPGGGRFTDLNPTLDTRAKDGLVRNQLAGAVITMAHGQGGAEIAVDRSPTLTCNHEAPIAALPVGVTIHGTDKTARVASYTDIAGCLRADVLGRIENSSTTVVQQPIAFHPTQDPISSTDGTTHGLGCGSSGGQASVAVAQPYTLAIRGRDDGHNLEFRQDGTANALLTPNGGRGGIGVGAISTCMQVRRLTPVECSRLQGFPDDYLSQVHWRGKATPPDGPMYKALGNSWAVPNVRWIGQRIAAFLG